MRLCVCQGLLRTETCFFTFRSLDLFHGSTRRLAGRQLSSAELFQPTSTNLIQARPLHPAIFSPKYTDLIPSGARQTDKNTLRQ
jgi:hypothetical protein